ncbi:hypothetical protein ALO94_200512 [Pseudomonas syringae pv. spinaceae]|uniref:LysR family transcriptional regulator n=1 Tax=Pseudomonas syringae pv. spinaceae TaxID=264459 RepID=A0A0P9ZB92_PSESX|nr:hypothetical protein ALO94_200512 [Pseudomonas syringae pv. spinaceae]
MSLPISDYHPALPRQDDFWQHLGIPARGTRLYTALHSGLPYEVFERLAQGANVNDIAQQLALSSKTISTHKARLMQKMKLNSLADLVKYAMEHKLL